MAVSRIEVELALDEIYENGVPEDRRSREYCLLSRGRHYPPKYSLAVANRYDTGHELRADEAYGAEDGANAELRQLGYEVIECKCRNHTGLGAS